VWKGNLFVYYFFFAISSYDTVSKIWGLPISEQFQFGLNSLSDYSSVASTQEFRHCLPVIIYLHSVQSWKASFEFPLAQPSLCVFQGLLLR